MRRFLPFAATMAAAVVVVVGLGGPALADGAGPPAGGNDAAPGVIERIFDAVFEKVAGSWLEEAPSPINPVSEIEKLEKNIKRSPLPEYEQLVKDAEKTGVDGVRPFYERLVDLIDRFRSLGDDETPDPRPPLPPCQGCSDENGN